MDVEPPLPDPLSPPPDTRFSTYRDRVYDRRPERHERSYDRHRPVGDRERRQPPTDQRERGSKALSMVLRHRNIPQMRKDGFVPWEALLQVEEVAGRWTSHDLVEVIEWSHNKDSQRRFEMALNLEDKGGIWVRATTRHTNGCNASQLPEGVTHETRSEADQKAMEAARRYGGPGSQRERRGYPRHDARGPPRPVARPLDSTMPVPPGENRPRTPGRARSMSRPRTPGRPRTPESAPPEPTRQHILRKVSTQMAPPILQEEPVRHLSDQSTTASVISRHSDFPEVEGKQKGNKVDWKLKEEYETESSQDPDGIQPGEPIEASSATRTSPSVAFNLEDDGSCEEMPAEEPFVSEWPAIILGVGKARKGFNGDAWSEQYPDDNNHYITFDENDMIARVPHPQDETEQLKEESLRWAFGLKKGTTVQGWYPQHFVDMKF